MRHIFLLMALTGFLSGMRAQQVLYFNGAKFTSSAANQGMATVNRVANVPGKGMFVLGSFDGMSRPGLFAGGGTQPESNAACITVNGGLVWYKVPMPVYDMAYLPDSSAILFYCKADSAGHTICKYDIASATYSMYGRVADSAGHNSWSGIITGGRIAAIDNRTVLIGGNMLHYGGTAVSYLFLYRFDLDSIIMLNPLLPSPLIDMARSGDNIYISFEMGASSSFSSLARFHGGAMEWDSAFSKTVPANMEMEQLLAADGKLYVAGWDSAFAYAIWKYDEAAGVWSRIASPDALITGLSFDGRYVEVSGEFGNISAGVHIGQLASYDPASGTWGRQYENCNSQRYAYYSGMDYIDSNLVCVDAEGNIATTEAPATGVQDMQSSLPLLYPNPATDRIMLKGLTPGMEIILADISGGVVYSNVAQSEDMLIATASFARGIYILHAGNMALKVSLE